MPNLTDTAIRNFKPAEKPYRRADRDGLWLLVTPTGSKSWQVRFVNPVTGKDDTLSLGPYPARSLLDARQATAQARTLIVQGIDPKARQKEAREAATRATAEARTFGEVFQAWTDMRAGHLEASSRDRDASVARNHILPDLGGRPIRAITRPDIAAVLRAVEAKRPSLVGKVREAIDGAFEYAAGHGYVETNPTPRTTRGMFKAHEERPMAWVRDPIEQGDMLAAMSRYRGQPATVTALNLLPYLMLRPGELRGLEWAEYQPDHPDGPRLAIGRHRMKARKGKAAVRGPHIVPLTASLVASIEALRPHTGRRTFMFPGSTPTQCLSEATLNGALDRLGYKGKQHPHGFRHMASTFLNQHRDRPGNDWHEDAIERQLDHGDSDATRDTYNAADYLDKRAKMLAAWADHLDRLKAEGLSRIKAADIA